MAKYGNAWLELALEIIRASNERMSLSAFLSYQKMALPQAGKGIKDRQRVLKVILDLGIVKVEEGILVLGSPSIPAWLSDSLIEGNEAAWGIVQEMDPIGVIGRKFDDANLKRIGAIGEEAVILELKKLIPSDMHTKIQKISDFDDTAGFDVLAPKDRLDNYLKLEVKTTSRPVSNAFSFYLSRNETRVAEKNINWFLVATNISNEKTTLLGHINFDLLRKYLPKDSHSDAEWQSVYITIQKSDLISGLPNVVF